MRCGALIEGHQGQNPKGVITCKIPARYSAHNNATLDFSIRYYHLHRLNSAQKICCRFFHTTTKMSISQPYINAIRSPTKEYYPKSKRNTTLPASRVHERGFICPAMPCHAMPDHFIIPAHGIPLNRLKLLPSHECTCVIGK